VYHTEGAQRGVTIDAEVTNGGATVNEHSARYRAGDVMVVLSGDETCALRMLLRQIARTCDVASGTLAEARPLPTGSEFRRFKELTAHMTAAVGRINLIVG